MEVLRNRIIQAASELFMEHGPKTVTMDQISDACGISKRTLYEQFTDKNRLLQLCLDRLNQQQMDLRQGLQQKSTNVIDYLIRSTRQTIEETAQFNPNFFPELKKYHPAIARNQEQFSEEILNRELIAIINKGIAEGLFREKTNVQIAVQLLKVQLEAIYFSDMIPKFNLNLGEVFHTIIFTFVRGIATPKGLQVLSAFETE